MKKSVQLLFLVVLCSAQFAKAQVVIDVNDITNYPYAAFIEDSQTGSSGNGAIISDTQVLTSAVAVNPAPGVKINVYVGNAFRRGGTFLQSKTVQKHPSYNPGALENNLAIITVDGTFKGMPNVRPISIWTGTTVDPVSCFSIGWGLVVNNDPNEYLRRVNYELINNADCSRDMDTLMPSTIQCGVANKGTGTFELSAFPFVCDNQLYGIQATRNGYFFIDGVLDIFTKVTAASVQALVPPAKTPRKNYVSCN